ncbi:AbrB/MazE/SpoVT family DNA-binding domain-containing protein [Candidatus Woesearchaeota archaeon]|nr:AbrB/MazE/SpoVT family DNA-binding domain-containing protein [Candidatus Woesearchaeota archaeon]
MKRKVILQGGKSLMVSLPIKWAKKFNVNKGDELETEVEGERVCYAAKGETKGRRVSVNLSGLSERLIRYILSGLHKSGYDEIEVHYDDQEVLNVIEDLTKNLFVGFAIIEQNSKKCVLRCISKQIPSEFDTALRRAFLVTLSMGDSILSALESAQFEQLSSIVKLEKTNNQLTNFCERLLNNYPFIYARKQHFLYVIIWNLEKVCDDYKYICHLLSKRRTPMKASMLGVFAKVNALLRGYYEVFYKFDLEQLHNLIQEREVIEGDIRSLMGNLDKDECMLLYYLLSATYKIIDFSASMVSIKQEITQKVQPNTPES